MTTKNLIIYSIFLLTALTACDSGNGQKITSHIASDSITRTIPISRKIDDRFSIVGDFNGDKLQDTIFESYISLLTQEECSKQQDSEDFEKDIELIIKQKPITRLYSTIENTDTFIVTTESQQRGIDMFSNLGDLNSDGSDEFGYIIDWADYSNFNTFHIMTLKDNKFKELFNFKVNESVNLEPENLIEGRFLVKAIDAKTVEYKFYSDSATVESGRHTFD
jgi:hypothetical protein